MEFEEIGRIKLTETKDLVVSKRCDGKVTIAQQIKVDDKGEEKVLFLKNTIVVNCDQASQLTSILQKF